jgi:hypothetical protein
MAGLGPAIHVLLAIIVKEDVDHRDKPVMTSLRETQDV